MTAADESYRAARVVTGTSEPGPLSPGCRSTAASIPTEAHVARPTAAAYPVTTGPGCLTEKPARSVDLVIIDIYLSTSYARPYPRVAEVGLAGSSIVHQARALPDGGQGGNKQNRRSWCVRGKATAHPRPEGGSLTMPSRKQVAGRAPAQQPGASRLWVGFQSDTGFASNRASVSGRSPTHGEATSILTRAYQARAAAGGAAHQQKAVVSFPAASVAEQAPLRSMRKLAQRVSPAWLPWGEANREKVSAARVSVPAGDRLLMA